MKYASISFLLLLTVCGTAQTFTTINQNSEHVFLLTEQFNVGVYPTFAINPYEPPFDIGSYPFRDSVIIGYGIDSVFVDSLNSQIFQFNKMKRVTSNSLLFQMCDSFSWLGQHMTKDFESETFKNALNEDIVYKTNAELGESWILYDGHAGTCQATLDSVVLTDTILGELDTIWTINLAWSMLYPLYTHVFDSDVQLSAKHGFINTFDHFSFPLDTNRITICGKSYPEVGLVPGDEESYHNYQVGDEWHSRSFEGEVNSYGTTTEVINQVDSIVETDSTILYFTSGEFCVSSSQYDTSYRNGGTFIEREIFVRKNYLEYLPFENANFVQIENGVATERRYKESGSAELGQCYNADSDSPGGSAYFERGIGLVNYFYQSAFWQVSEYDLKYYSIRGQEFGTPLDLSDCIVSVYEKELLSNISIYPNPTSAVLFIENETQEQTLNLELLDLNGKTMLKHICENQTELDLSVFSEGLYLLKLVSEKDGTYVMMKIQVVH